MKKIISILLILAVVLSCSMAAADIGNAKKISGGENRDIKVNKAGDNPWPTDGTSPTTGRDLAAVYQQYIADDPDSYSGMAETGIYSPIMVQHCGFNGGVDIGAPFYGASADIYYEQVKAQRGYTRFSMIYNDVLPPYAGASRSIRVGHLFVRQEWNAPFLYAGKQEQTFSSKWNTDVNYMRTKLGIPTSYSDDIPMYKRVMFDALDGGKPWLAYKYRYAAYGRTYNLVWNLAAMGDQLLAGRHYDTEDNAFNRTFNHTLKFGDMAVEGDPAETVYVIFESGTAMTSDSEGTTYFNSMYSYDPDENVYYRYMISNMANPELNPVLFREQKVIHATSEVVEGSPTKNGYFLYGETVPGDAITFANVIVQFIDMEFPNGEAPYAILEGRGNADYFMGGKHYAGVWERESLNNRTIFYGEDGNEISLQPGRTIIVLMDYKTTFGDKHREVKYE